MNTGIKTSSALYLDLADSLRSAIVKGRWKPGQMIGSEHGLARTRKLSRVTVRKASERLVQEGLLERRPGKGLFVRTPGSDTGIIQLVAGNLAWAPAIQVARGMQEVVGARGGTVQLHDAHGDAMANAERVRRLADGPARGAVILGLTAPAFIAALYELRARNFPFVLVDQRLHDLPVPSVQADNRAGGRLAAGELLERGHRCIAFLGDLAADTVRARCDGLRDAIDDQGLPFDRSLVVDLKPDDPFADWSPLVADAVTALMARPAPPTAIMASCDAVARAAVLTLRRLGRRVPDEVSLTGFDDDPLAELVDPPLTTVRQPFTAMGRAAGDLLYRLMAGQSADAQVLPVELVRRASVATRKTDRRNA